jgi:hypothetical protein
MLNLDIIKAVYAKEFRELTQDTRTLFIVFLIPLLFMPAISLTTYSSNVTSVEGKQLVAVIDEKCNDSALTDLSTLYCAASSQKAEVMQDLHDAQLEAVLDVNEGKIYLANATLTSEQTRQAIEKYHLSTAYSDLKQLSVEDLDSKESVLSIVGTSLANVLVMLVIVFSFVGALNFGIDVTTGEKERGSFKLYSEFKERISSIFAGKLIFTSLCSGLTAVLGIAGIIISMLLIDTFYGDQTAMTPGETEKITAFFEYVKMLSFTDIFVATVYLIPAIFVVSSLVNFTGCLARNMKEAKLLGVLLILVIMALTKVDLGAENFFITAFIPVVNVFAGVNNAMTQTLDWWHLLVSTIVNVSICFNSLYDIKRLVVKEII